MGENGAQLERPEDKVFLTFDFDGDILRMLHMGQDFGDKVHAVKLGIGFAKHRRSYELRRAMHAQGIATFLDAKYMDDPDQAAYNIKEDGEAGYRYVSVAAYVGKTSLSAAVEAAAPYDMQIVASLKDRNKRTCYPDLEVDTIKAVNKDIAPKYQIGAVMCNAGQLERVKNLDLLKIATGIRIKPDSIDDHPVAVSPSEALSLGANMIAVGRPIVESPEPQEALARYLDDMR
jgi:orotidine-5'-phosphate decarboxylase